LLTDGTHRSLADSEEEGPRQWLVTVKGPITDTLLENVNSYAEPCQLGQYFPDNTFLLVWYSTSASNSHITPSFPLSIYLMTTTNHHQ
jgi:hypothetical protein